MIAENHNFRQFVPISVFICLNDGKSMLNIFLYIVY
jgi:hypothetical protein